MKGKGTIKAAMPQIEKVVLAEIAVLESRIRALDSRLH
jgi:hypothetical protein